MGREHRIEDYSSREDLLMDLTVFCMDCPWTLSSGLERVQSSIPSSYHRAWHVASVQEIFDEWNSILIPFRLDAQSVGFPSTSPLKHCLFVLPLLSLGLDLHSHSAGESYSLLLERCSLEQTCKWSPSVGCYFPYFLFQSQGSIVTQNSTINFILSFKIRIICLSISTMC